MIKLKTWVKVAIAFSQRLFRFSIDLLIIFFNLINNLIIYRKPYQNNIIFVTAAEKNYFKQLDSNSEIEFHIDFKRISMSQYIYSVFRL